LSPAWLRRVKIGLHAKCVLGGPPPAGQAGDHGLPDLRNYAKGEGRGTLVDLYDELIYGDPASLPFRGMCGWAKAAAKGKGKGKGKATKGRAGK
jgi:hypothetical protein